jgi:urease accessory protein
MNKLSWNFVIALVLAGLTPSIAEAHPGLHAHGFADGFAHPFTGLDHLCAMVAVGYWAASLGGSARWIAPAAFVCLMAMGALLGLNAVALPAVEYGIAASVVALGLLVAFDVRMPVAAAAALVGGFALFHGYAHGSEMPAASNALYYGGGFLLATVMLHAIGLTLGSLRMNRVFGRLAGGAIALTGCYFAFAA